MRTILLVAIWLGLAGLSFGQNATDPHPRSLFDSLNRAGYIQLTVETDLRQLLRKKDDYQAALLRFEDRAGQPRTLEVKVKPRGKMRKQICEFPPLKMKFKYDGPDSLVAKALSSLKLVTPCHDASNFEQFVLREYLAYRLHNLLTPYSFRVQLAKILFVDSNGDKAPMQSFAILLEHPDELAARLGGKILANNVRSEQALNTPEFEQFCLFQFMIGNTDWHPYAGHNMVLFGKPGMATPVPIPYDFDYAGLVNAPYAAPNDQVDIKDVTDRFYQGYCGDWERLQQSLQPFLEQETAMLEAIGQVPGLSERSLKYCTKYLNSFFEIIESKRNVKRLISGNCNRYLGS